VLSNAHHCPKCNLPRGNGMRVGSLTSFLFMDMHCQCDRTKAVQANPQPKSNSQSCKRCGKVIAGPKRLGSFTAFLLKDLRCSCAKPLLQVGSADVMATRYRPPQATWGKRQQQIQTALRTKASNTFAKDAALISLAPGTTIGGCYQLIEMVGKGGMGVVYKARHRALDRTLALKFLAPSMVSRESWQLFQQEAKLNATLSHPSLCQIYDLGIHANALPFYAMDFIDGQTLEEVIMGTGPLSVGATLEIFIKVAEGLSYAHRRNVVHRDIKPANIMIADTTGDTTEIKLLDFGIAELGEKQGREGGQEAKKIIGSAAYMSPEQFAGRTTDARSDIYSLGCTIYETLTGALPFDSEDFDTLDRQHSTAEPPLLSDTTNIAYPQELEAVIKKCLHKSRDRRYQNASELAIDLQRILSHKDLQFARAEQESLQQAQRTKSDHLPSARIVLVAVLAVALIVLIALQITESTHSFLSKQNLPLPSAQNPKTQNNPNPQESKLFDQEALQDISSDPRLQNLREIKENEFFVSSKPSSSKIPTRTFRFPNAGIPMVLIAKTAKGLTAIKCTGTVEVTSEYLELLPSSTYDADQLIRGFRPQDITGLDLTRCIASETNLLRDSLTRFKLKSLRLSKAQCTSTNFKLLQNMAPNSYLELKGEVGSQEAMPMGAKLPAIPNVDTLALTNLSLPLQDIMSTPTKMPFSTLLVTSCPLTKKETLLISQWPNLRVFQMHTLKRDGSFLEPLLNSSRLKTLTITDSELDLRTIDLSKLSTSNRALNLTFVGLRQTSSNFEQLHKLRTKFPSATYTSPLTDYSLQ